jgi:hypothetical protein
MIQFSTHQKEAIFKGAQKRKGLIREAQKAANRAAGNEVRSEYLDTILAGTTGIGKTYNIQLLQYFYHSHHIAQFFFKMFPISFGFARLEIIKSKSADLTYRLYNFSTFFLENVHGFFCLCFHIIFPLKTEQYKCRRLLCWYAVCYTHFEYPLLDSKHLPMHGVL